MTNLVYALNRVLTAGFDLLFRPLGLLSPLLSLTLFSAATGLLMVWVFGRVSNQEKIRTVKDRIQANLIAVRLFQNSVGVFFRIQGRIFLSTLLYMGLSLKPMLVMIVPVLLVLIQLQGREYLYDDPGFPGAESFKKFVYRKPVSHKSGIQHHGRWNFLFPLLPGFEKTIQIEYLKAAAYIKNRLYIKDLTPVGCNSMLEFFLFLEDFELIKVIMILLHQVHYFKIAPHTVEKQWAPWRGLINRM